MSQKSLDYILVFEIVRLINLVSILVVGIYIYGEVQGIGS